jgi:hypothetical protein
MLKSREDKSIIRLGIKPVNCKMARKEIKIACDTLLCKCQLGLAASGSLEKKTEVLIFSTSIGYNLINIVSKHLP